MGLSVSEKEEIRAALAQLELRLDALRQAVDRDMADRWTYMAALDRELSRLRGRLR